jgi:hypothetical protein
MDMRGCGRPDLVSGLAFMVRGVFCEPKSVKQKAHRLWSGGFGWVRFAFCLAQELSPPLGAMTTAFTVQIADTTATRLLERMLASATLA